MRMAFSGPCWVRWWLLVDDLHCFALRARAHSHFYRLLLCLFQRLLPGKLVVVDQGLVGAADLGNGGPDRIRGAEELRLGDAARPSERFGQENGAAANKDDVYVLAGDLHHVNAFLHQFPDGSHRLLGQ